MKKLFLLFLALGLQANAWAFSNDLLSEANVKNSTGTKWQYLYISAKDSDAWCADLLGTENPLEADGSKVIYLNNNEETDTYDILAVAEDGKKFQKEFTAKQGESFDVEVFESDENGSFDSLFQTVTLVNGTDVVFDYVFFSTDQSAVWGPDLLGKDKQLGAGASLSFLLPLYNVEGGIPFNFLAVDEKGKEYQLTINAAGSEDPLDVTMDSSHLQQDQE